MNNLKKLYIIFILAAMVKVALALFFNRPEVFEYEGISNSILARQGFRYVYYGVEYRSFVQPFYPIFTALVYYLTNHSHIVMLIIQSIVSSSLCFIIYFIAMRLASQKEAILAGFLVAFHPALTVYSIFKLHPLVFDAFFYLLSVLVFLRFIERPRIRNAIVAGIIFGVSILSRSTIVPFFIFCIIFVLVALKQMVFQKRFSYAMIICLVAFLIYLPWIARNYFVFHKLVVMQTVDGENLWAGNNTLATGSPMLLSGISVHERKPASMKNELDRLDELGQQRYYVRSFLNFIKERPGLFSVLFLKKFLHFWWFSPYTGTLYSKVWLHIYKIYYYILSLLFTIGIYSLLKEKKHFKLLLILFVYGISIALIHAVVNIQTRHRWTVEPILIIFASIGFLQLIAELMRCVRLENIRIKKV